MRRAVGLRLTLGLIIALSGDKECDSLERVTVSIDSVDQSIRAREREIEGKGYSEISIWSV